MPSWPSATCTSTAPPASSWPRSRSPCVATRPSNPNAKYRDPITVEDVLASRIISSPLHLLDCCIISDGGGALVLTSVERARDLAQPPVVILGGAEAVQHHGIGRRDLLDIAARQSGPLALERAGVAHADIDMAMIYDSFTITVLATLESLGFCKPGEGGAFCADGRIGLGGALPINTDGGGLSSNHPGMRGIFLVIEATKQLRRSRGARAGTRRRARAGARHRRHAGPAPQRRHHDPGAAMSERTYRKPVPRA